MLSPIAVATSWSFQIRFRGLTVHAEEDQSYAKSSLGPKTEEKQGISKVLGVQWDVGQDKFQLDIGDVALMIEDSEPTKRSVVSISARFFRSTWDYFPGDCPVQDILSETLRGKGGLG